MEFFKRNLLIVCVILISVVGSLAAETSLSPDMKFLQTVYRGTDSKFYSVGNGTAGLTFRSKGNADVKGDLLLDFIPLDAAPGGTAYPYFDLKKASVKVRFPGLRLTMGKTRISWGGGTVFNSGDVLFGSLSPQVDLTQDEARDETAWLTLVRWSPGTRTYLEAVYMPPAPEIDPETGSHSIPDGTNSSQGGRLVTEILDLTVEAGYLYKGEKKVLGDVTGHRPYLTLHGELYFDLYASASMAIPYDNPQWDSYRGSLNISGGMMRQFQIWYDGILSARLEFLLFPYQKWEEQDGRLTGEDSTYALFLYPEFNLAVGQNLNLPLMALVSPIDGSLQITTGFDWKVYQGFSFLGYGIFGLGEKEDVFAWDRGNAALESDEINGLALMVGMRYTF